MSDIRSEKTKLEFIDYLEKHPLERFWQSVRNFSGYAFIIASDGLPTRPEQLDTFYWEEKNHPGYDESASEVESAGGATK